MDEDIDTQCDDNTSILTCGCHPRHSKISTLVDHALKIALVYRFAHMALMAALQLVAMVA